MSINGDEIIVTSCITIKGDACFAGTYQPPEKLTLENGEVMHMPVSARTLNNEIAAAGGFDAYQAQIRKKLGTLPMARGSE